MIRKEFLELLRCPLNLGSLANAEPALLDRLNVRIAAGTLVNRGGETVLAPLEGGLVDEATTLLYPVQNEIPCLLVDEAISLDQLSAE